MSLIRLPRLSAMAAMVLVAPLFITAPSSPVSAQSDWADLDCNDLWHERNGLYAHYGHCFTTARGIAAFHNKPDYPNVCKPPHGKLPADAAADVAAIQKEERKKKCR